MAKLSIQNLTGQTFGRLTVLFRTPNRKYHWICRCECQTVKSIYEYSLKSGVSLSCGCLRDEKSSNRWRKHGMINRPEYRIWQAMRRRCDNPKDPDFRLYGERGITVCDRWRTSFQNFFDDMGPRPSRNHSIDRRDNGKGYCPENCRWSTAKEQANNQRTNHMVEYFGERMTLTQAAERAGLEPSVVFGRINRRGWTIAKALATPVMTRSECALSGAEKRRHNA